MGNFSSVQIRFKDSDGKARAAIVDFDAAQVQAIFLRGAEDDFVITKKGEAIPIPREITPVKPDGVDLMPEAGLLEGPGQVCYLENGVLKCWFPS